MTGERTTAALQDVSLMNWFYLNTKPVVPRMSSIYESPDRGDTVYRREFGQYGERELVRHYGSESSHNETAESVTPPIPL